jgi:hypothetical protein
VHQPAEPGRSTQEVIDERGGRVIVDGGGRGKLLDPACVHHRDLVGDLEGLLPVVGDEDGGDAELVVEAPQPAAELLPYLGVEGPERLVQEEHARLDGESAGEGHSLALSARELARIAVAERLELHQPEQLAHAGTDLAL